MLSGNNKKTKKILKTLKETNNKNNKTKVNLKSCSPSASSNKKTCCWFWFFGRESDFLSTNDFRGLNPVINKYFEFL